MLTAIVKYSDGQTDEEGRSVSTTPFPVIFDPQDGNTREDAISATGDVQFEWELIRVVGL